MKIAFVIQRCGTDVYGGAEALTLQAALHLSKEFDVEILSTKARDASTWKNHYVNEIEKIDNLTIRRFDVDVERDPNFVPLSQYLETHNDDIKKGQEFINANGPVSRNLMTFIKNNQEKYDLFIFVGYLYWQTLNGMLLVPDKSILLSTAHDEPWIYFKIYEDVFKMAQGYLFLTNAEKEFVHKKFDTISKPYQIVGHGVEIDLNCKKIKRALPEKYLLYVGRISAGKGCQILSDYFNKYAETHSNNITLVMVGTLEHPLNNCNALILENLSDEEKFAVIERSAIFVMPSQFESLNIACLEAWLFSKPVIVNEKSEVLKEHCLRGQCGLFFKNYDEFAAYVDLLVQDKSMAKTLGDNGFNYVKENYGWKSTVKKYKEFFEIMLNLDKV